MLANFWVENIPLSQFEPELQRANLHIYGGTFESKGLMEYTPKIRRFTVDEATVDGIHLDYVHTAQTATGRKATPSRPSRRLRPKSLTSLTLS